MNNEIFAGISTKQAFLCLENIIWWLRHLCRTRMHHTWPFYVDTALSQFKNTDWLLGCDEGYLVATCVTNCDKDLSAKPLLRKRRRSQDRNEFLCTDKGPVGGLGGGGWGALQLVPLTGGLVSIIGGCLIIGVAPQREADTFTCRWESA